MQLRSGREKKFSTPNAGVEIIKQSEREGKERRKEAETKRRDGWMDGWMEEILDPCGLRITFPRDLNSPFRIHFELL